MYRHLQHAMDVEFWTIPLYLTALYSIKGLRNMRHEDYPDAAKLLESVVIQEMLHLELVCNISNAVGYSPFLLPPQYEDATQIPFIHPDPETLPGKLQGYECKLGPLNKSTLKLLCVIEFPHENSEQDPGIRESYASLASMYNSLITGLKEQWDECFVGSDQNRKQKKAFSEYETKSGRRHGFSIAVNSLKDALNAIEAIIEQGEGSNRLRVSAEFRPPKQKKGEAFDPGWFRGDLSHYNKFRLLLRHRKHLPEVYAVTGEDVSIEQAQLDTAYNEFVDELNFSFNSEGSVMPPLFWKKMYGLSHAIISVWEKGACPVFTRKQNLRNPNDILRDPRDPG